MRDRFTSRRGQAKLWFVAAALALAASVVRYARSGEIGWGLVAAALFLLAMGIVTLRQRPPDPAPPPPEP